jgi:hypothetical protein
MSIRISFLMMLQNAALRAVTGVLHAGIPRRTAISFRPGRSQAQVFGAVLPNARYRYYDERDGVCAAGLPACGVAVVAATGATAWGARADDGRKCAGRLGLSAGGGGSAYAAGLPVTHGSVGLRMREPTPPCW